MPHFDDYPKPAVTVDIIVLVWDGRTLSVPLIQRGGEPFKGQWAIPGGFLEMNETLEDAARRELREEAGVDSKYLAQGPVFDAVDRDPRGRVISVPHVALLGSGEISLTHGSDAADARLFLLDSLPAPLAFDHVVILDSVRAYAAQEVERGQLGRQFDEKGRTSIVQQLRGSKRSG